MTDIKKDKNKIDQFSKHIQQKKRGAPVKYNAEIHPIAILSMYAAGMTDEQVAIGIGINRLTLHKWRKKYPELSNTEKVKSIADGKVEEMLNKRALGYEVDESEITASIDENGSPIGRKILKKKKRHIPADITAMIFWLKNRQPQKWRDRREISATINDYSKYESELKNIISIVDSE